MKKIFLLIIFILLVSNYTIAEDAYYKAKEETDIYFSQFGDTIGKIKPGFEITKEMIIADKEDWLKLKLDFNKGYIIGWIQTDALLPLNNVSSSNLDSNEVVLTVTLSNVSLVYNNSVGNDWSIGAYINGEYIKKYKSYELSLSDKKELQLKATAMESDKVPDFGSSSKTIVLSDLDLGKENKITLYVVVRENRGRYAGNTAKWQFDFILAKK